MKPMHTKMSLISSRALYMGCLWPIFTVLPGTVTSRASALSRASMAADSSFLPAVSMALSRAERTSLARAPMAGRSSADSRPICLSTAVS